tara:strand:+ start:1901 stop:2362 length:462 start_codon:yes stop_codon:yes gene_type:complete
MTPPRWQFFPAPVSSGGAKLVFTGTAVRDLSSSGSTTFNSFAKSGSDADDFLEYPFNPIRRSTAYMEILFKIDTGETYSNVGDFESAVTMVSETSSFKIGGNTFPHTSVTHTHGSNSGAVIRMRFNAASSAVTTFRNLLAAGDAIEITMNWTT